MAEPEQQSAAENKQLEFNPAKFKDYVEVIGKVVLYIGAFCYAVGILVESLYLGSFGIFHVTLFRFTYVFAGLWAIMLFATPILPISFFIINQRWRVYRDAKNRLDVREFLLLIFFTIVIFSAEIWGIALFQIPIIYILFPLLMSFAAALVSLIMYRFFFRWWSGETRDSFIFYLQILTGMSITFYLSIYMGIFATTTFPQIPARLGGGKPLTVQLLLEVNKENARMIQKNFDLCDSDKAKAAAPEENQLVATKPMSLLLATDADYIIRKDENTAVSITRDQVKTVLYLDNVDPGKDVCADPK